MSRLLHTSLLLFLFAIAEIQGRGNDFQVAFQWTHLNYTWQTPKQYQNAVAGHAYIQQNNAIAGIKIYQDRVYLAIPTTFRYGVPVTLGSISLNGPVTDQLVEPFPDWNTGSLINGNLGNCDVLQSVISMEIDKNGIMWVLDGTRKANSKCPTKLTLFNLKTKKKIHTYTFPESISSATSGLLKDIVLDGDYAYISEPSFVDPGLIVYSRSQDRAWKWRDSTMFAVRGADNFDIDGADVVVKGAISGIALTPFSLTSAHTRNVYYCSIAGYNLYSIDVRVLQNQTLYSDGFWRDQVKLVGRKIAQTDTLTIDNKGNMYFSLLPLYSIEKWNIETNFATARIIDTNRTTMTWPESWAFDNKGNVYTLASNIHKYFDPDIRLIVDGSIKFRILSLFTNTKSYLY